MRIWFIASLAMLSTWAQAETRYISDDIFIYLRSGPGDAYRMMGSVPAGVPVEVKQENKAAGYTEIIDHKERLGWVKSSDLQTEPSFRVKAEQNDSSALQDEVAALSVQLKTLQAREALYAQLEKELAAAKAALDTKATTPQDPKAAPAKEATPAEQDKIATLEQQLADALTALEEAKKNALPAMPAGAQTTYYVEQVKEQAEEIKSLKARLKTNQGDDNRRFADKDALIAEQAAELTRRNREIVRLKNAHQDLVQQLDSRQHDIQMDWFLRGGILLLVGLALGLLIQKLAEFVSRRKLQEQQQQLLVQQQQLQINHQHFQQLQLQAQQQRKPRRTTTETTDKPDNL